MKYQAGQRRKANEYEKSIAEWWKKNKIFEQSVQNRSASNSYVFYDGPPFLTGLPHHGHLLGSTIKDVVGRYQTMQGKRVERVWGWDCHGLPAENYVEKQLGITDRRDIGTKWSLEEYIRTAQKSMQEISDEWEHTITRIGRWVEFKGAYRTMDKDFMESVWWAFKQLYDAGKIYEGRKVLMYDTKFATPVSKAEVTMDNDAYQTVTDPSAYVKFRIREGQNGLAVSEHFASPSESLGDESSRVPDSTGRRPDSSTRLSPGAQQTVREREPILPAYLLAWTTTPWTLMANRALAVNGDLEYGIYNIEGENLIVAVKLAEKIFAEVAPKKTLKGKDLAGLKYESLDGTECQVFTADFVGEEEGTGIVHCAPAYGEDDYQLYLDHQGEIEFVDTLDENGYYIEEYADKLRVLGMRDTDDHGIQIWAANKFIAKVLEEKGIIYKIEYIQHEYPFNPRSKERIMYRAFPSWFFDIQGQKPLMLEQNENINWFPDYLKHGRFAKNIEAAPDWNLSRDRFWATAMPVWKGEKTGAIKVFGSYEELEQYSGQKLDDYHRPWVDEIEFDAYVIEAQENASSRVCAVTTSTQATEPRNDGREGATREEVFSASSAAAVRDHFVRVEKVLDCWFESGSMPFAQMHYPFENKEKFESNYPADFITEYVGQVRAWFYYVHAVNTALADIGAFGEKAQQGDKNAFKNVITTGTIAGNDGRKMSKSIGNFTDPNILMDQYSADALRFLLLSSPVCAGEDFALLDKDVSDVHRKLAMIWNVYDFFTTYAEIEGLDSEELEDAISRHCTGPARPLGRELPKANSQNYNVSGSSTELVIPAQSRRTRCDFDDRGPSTPRNSASNPLDTWIISRIYQLRDEITTGMEEYNLPRALSGVVPFIDDLSNWFVRRSRRRFSKNDDAEDKQNAFATLYCVLVYLAQLLAPFTPFLAEELYQKMTGQDRSVHLLDWPAAGEINTEVLEEMGRTRQIITDALALRMQKSETEDQIKIRQPLSTLTYPGNKLNDFYEQIIAEEVNVKQVKNTSELTLDKTLTEELKREGQAREIIRAVQSARKHAGLKQDDQIKLSLSIDPPEEHLDLIKSEVGATTIEKDANFTHDEIAKVNGENITISLEKI